MNASYVADRWCVVGFLLLLLLFVFFRVVPTACGSSQARGLIRAIVAGLRHSLRNVGSEPSL